MAQRETIDKLKGQNEFLKKEVLSAKADNQTITVKLVKIENMNELRAEYQKIKDGTFFETKNKSKN